MTPPAKRATPSAKGTVPQEFPRDARVRLAVASAEATLAVYGDYPDAPSAQTHYLRALLELAAAQAGKP